MPLSDAPPPADRWLFLRKFLKHGTRVASVAPSSPALAAAMSREVRADRPQTIVELGAGTGAVTSAVAARLHPDSRLIAVELDPDFATLLSARCPRAEVWCANVTELSARLRDAEIASLDLVLSGLPTPSLPRAVNQAVVATLEEFAPAATFSQLTLMPWVYLGLYRRLFAEVEFQLVLRSTPPGGVYHCRALRPAAERQVPGK